MYSGFTACDIFLVDVYLLFFYFIIYTFGQILKTQPDRA